MPRYTPEEIAGQVSLASAMEDAGCEASEIARALGISRDTVFTRLGQRTTPRRERKLPEPVWQPGEIERKRKMAKVLAEYHKLPPSEIAAMLKVPWRTVRIWLSG